MKKNNKIIIIIGIALVLALASVPFLLKSRTQEKPGEIGDIYIYPNGEEGDDFKDPDTVFQYYALNELGDQMIQKEIKIVGEGIKDVEGVMHMVMVDLLGENHGIEFVLDEEQNLDVIFHDDTAYSAYYLKNENYVKNFPDERPNPTDIMIPEDFQIAFLRNINETIRSKEEYSFVQDITIIENGRTIYEFPKHR